jgi:hypothetical protein
MIIVIVILRVFFCSIPASGLIVLWTMWGGMNGHEYYLKLISKPHIGQKVMFEPLKFEWRRRGTVVGFEMRGNSINAVLVRRLFRFRTGIERIWEVPDEKDLVYRKVYHDISW